MRKKGNRKTGAVVPKAKRISKKRKSSAASSSTMSRRLHLRKKRKQVRETLTDAHYNHGYTEGYNNGYNNGYRDADLINRDDNSYNEGFDAGFDKGRNEGYSSGYYDGGDRYVDTLLPHHAILPELTVQQIIATGLKQLQAHYCTLQSSSEIYKRIEQAMNLKQPLSIIRLGDGELLTMAHDLVLSNDEVKEKGPFLNYAGVEIPDLAARNALAESVRRADIVGIPKLRLPNYMPLVLPVMKAHGIDYRSLQLTFSTINYMLHSDGLLAPLLQGRRVIVIGNQGRHLTQLLAAEGIDVAEPVEHVKGVNDISRVLDIACKQDFDIALVSAGIAAVIIAEKIAKHTGKVAIDFGHLANSLVNGEAVWNNKK